MHYVEIVQLDAEADDDPVIRRMGPHDQRTAEKIARGAEINLNWDRYFVRVVEE